MSNLRAMSDHELVALYGSGNDSAFDVLLERYQDYVYTYIVFLVKREDVAEDLLQETFVKSVMAIRKGMYQPTGKFGAWLVRIAHNLVVEHLRGKEQTQCVLKDEFSHDVLNSIGLSQQSREKELVDGQYVHTLRDMLDYLPAEQRKVVELRFFEDMSFKEIAQLTGVSINTSLGRMRYALINLRHLIAKHHIQLMGA